MVLSISNYYCNIVSLDATLLIDVCDQRNYKNIMTVDNPCVLREGTGTIFQLASQTDKNSTNKEIDGYKLAAECITNGYPIREIDKIGKFHKLNYDLYTMANAIFYLRL